MMEWGGDDGFTVCMIPLGDVLDLYRLGARHLTRDGTNRIFEGNFIRIIRI
jgi:hypothetical protein